METTRIQERSRPLVSIIIACYNQGHFLPEALDSALGQTYPHVEVILVDDGSTDHTPEVASRYGEWIRCIRKPNTGLSAARNAGILEAKGEFILFLDADDYLWPDMVERHMEAARARSSGDILIGGWQEVDVAGQILRPKRAKSLPEDAFHALLAGDPFPIHCMIIRRSTLANSGLFDVQLQACEDWDLLIRLAAAGCEFLSVPDAVAVYRRYPGSMSTDAEREWLAILAVLRKSRAYHTNCGRCRRMLARGRRELRVWCFGLLRNELRGYRKKGQIWAGVAKVARTATRAPALASLFLAEPFSPLRRGAGRLRRRLATVLVGRS